jgi:hypothetical protein
MKGTNSNLNLPVTPGVAGSSPAWVANGPVAQSVERRYISVLFNQKDILLIFYKKYDIIYM